MRTAMSKIGLMMLLSALVMGCDTVSIAKQHVGEDGKPLVVYKERNFMNKLQVLDLKSRDNGGLLEVNATLRNRWDMKLSFSYQFRFFDADGFQIDPEGRPWTPIELVGEDQKVVRAVAPNPKAKSYQLVVTTGIWPD